MRNRLLSTRITKGTGPYDMFNAKLGNCVFYLGITTISPMLLSANTNTIHAEQTTRHQYTVYQKGRARTTGSTLNWGTCFFYLGTLLLHRCYYYGY